jgi:hypothetical protein
LEAQWLADSGWQWLAAVPATGYGGMAVRAIKKFSMAKLFSFPFYFLAPPSSFRIFTIFAS